MRRRYFLAFATGVILASTTGSARADIGFRPAAYGGVVVWSQRDAAKDLWRLRVRKGPGPSRTLSLAPRSVPFDVDLGPGRRRGEIVAVYSRCAREPEARFEEQPRYTAGRGCRLYSFSLATQVERRLLGSRATAGTEVLPTIWRGRLVFAGRTRGAVPPRAHWFERRLGRPTARRLTDGTLGRLTYLAGPGSAEGGRRNPDNYYDAAGGGPVAADLRGADLAFLWALDASGCGGPVDVPNEFSRQIELWTVALRSRGRLVDKTCEIGGEASRLFGLATEGSRVFYGALGEGTGQVWLRAYNRAGGTYARSAAPVSLRSFAISAGRVFYARDRSSPARPLPHFTFENFALPTLTPTGLLAAPSAIGPPTGSTQPAAP